MYPNCNLVNSVATKCNKVQSAAFRTPASPDVGDPEVRAPTHSSLRAPSVDAAPLGRTALFLACAHGRLEIVKFLFVNGANLQGPSADGRQHALLPIGMPRPHPLSVRKACVQRRGSRARRSGYCCTFTKMCMPTALTRLPSTANGAG